MQSSYCFNEIYDLSLTGGRFSEWNGQTIPVRACVMHPLREVTPPGNGIECVLRATGFSSAYRLLR